MKKILLIGSGSLKIGEAGEFDYSGTQAIKALREEGLESILINPNIASIQTTEGVADRIYFLPITQEFIVLVIKKENPQGILLSTGGQTALNCGIQLYVKGILKYFRIKILGTNIQNIISSEDRDQFIAKLGILNINTARNKAIISHKEIKEDLKKIGFPLIIRVAYALGGLGSGFAYNIKELHFLIEKALAHTSLILIEESLKGWKEIEYEVVRDKYGNCITVCNMENIDPIGIHTGESIIVAPSQTLTDLELQKLRMLSINIAHTFNIIGECNIQFALSPISEDYRVIEINARLSRSSALASKATGYPLAFIATKLTLGYGLYELRSILTKYTSSFFEPTLNYIVCKFPRWDFKKFHRVSNIIGSNMKSVGEVMAIGGTFEEAFQKGLRMLDLGLEGFINPLRKTNFKLLSTLSSPTDNRVEIIEKKFNEGCSIEQLYNITNIDPWFLYKLRNLHCTKGIINSYKENKSFPEEWFSITKKQGFSDQQIATILQYRSKKGYLRIRKIRKIMGIFPYPQYIETMASEFLVRPNYLYMSYNSSQHNIEFVKKKESIVILGSGSYRLGSSIEFDWCCVNTLQTLNIHDYYSIIINCNPETVSTDFDECDRLYFEELSFERIIDIIEYEDPIGTIISVGGQISNNLALKLFYSGNKILGTSPLSLDGIENRYNFSKVLDILGIQQPIWKELSNLQNILYFITSVGYPILIRPSYVLSGASMYVIFNRLELNLFLKKTGTLGTKGPVVLSKFIENSKELELDAVSYKGDILYHAISEHIEYAGIHSGDASLIYPKKNIRYTVIKQIEQNSKKIAEYFHISGPFNIQFIYKNNFLLVIECNLRASRSFPFISKISGFNMIRFVTELFLEKRSVYLPKKHLPSFFYLKHIGTKTAQFSFSRLNGSDPVLGVDMVSTGEAGALGKNINEAFIKSMLAVGFRIPRKKILISGEFIYVHSFLRKICIFFIKNGYFIFLNDETHPFFIHYNLSFKLIDCLSESQIISRKQLDLIINNPNKIRKNELNNNYTIRRTSIDFNIPLFTNIKLAYNFIVTCYNDPILVKDWKTYF